MKYLSILLVILLFFTAYSYAQEPRKTDDALLLEHYQNQRFAEALSYLKTIYTEPVTGAKELSRLAYTAGMAKLLPVAADYYQRIYDRDSTNQVYFTTLPVLISAGGIIKTLNFILED